MAEPKLSSDREHRADEDLVRWQSELTYFENSKEQLWQNCQYRDKYVAIRRQTVVGVDEDKFQLAKRMAEQFPDDVVFVAKVAEDAPPVRLPSPRLN